MQLQDVQYTPGHLCMICITFNIRKVDTKIKLYRTSTWIKADVDQLLIMLLWGSSDSFDVAESIFFTSKVSAKRQQHMIRNVLYITFNY